MKITKSLLTQALALEGFDNWQPEIDVTHIQRPRQRPDELPGTGKTGSVLLMVYERDDETKLVLTRRRDDLPNHAGQISLPGGRQEQNENLDTTALRETEEEIGIRSDRIELLGKLNPVYIPPSDFTVTPFVGWHQGPPTFSQQETEVAEIIETPFDILLDKHALTTGEVANGSKVIQAPYYRVSHHRVWGATALILTEMLERLRRTERTS